MVGGLGMYFLRILDGFSELSRKKRGIGLDLVKIRKNYNRKKTKSRRIGWSLCFSCGAFWIVRLEMHRYSAVCWLSTPLYICYAIFSEIESQLEQKNITVDVKATSDSMGSWIVRQSVGSTPCLLGKAVDYSYLHGPDYLEPNTENADGVTALLSAVAAGSLPCLEVLIELPFGERYGDIQSKSNNPKRIFHVESLEKTAQYGFQRFPSAVYLQVSTISL